MERDAVLQSVFNPVRTATTFEETVERLGSAIRAGILPAGTRLPAERDLADQLGISRSTLRQALNTLVQSGHLVSVRGRQRRLVRQRDLSEPMRTDAPAGPVGRVNGPDPRC